MPLDNNMHLKEIEQPIKKIKAQTNLNKYQPKKEQTHNLLNKD